MKVVDIRNMAAASNVELIRVDERTICYAEEKNEEGHNSLFLLSYDRATRRETIIANYFLTNPSYVQHYTLMGNDLIVVMENGGSVIWVLRLDVETGEEKNLEEIHLIGSFAGSVVLSASQLLLFTSENDLHKKLCEDYRSLTGLSQVVYLYDIDERRYVYVRDARLCSLRPEQISLFSSGGESQLLIQETYGSEQEKETCYRERRWLEKRIWDRIWACPLSRFLQSVQAHEEYLPLLRLFGADTDGMVRFCSEDRRKLYFRAVYFPKDDERILAIDKETGERSIAAVLRRDDDTSFTFFDRHAGRAYRLQEMRRTYRITGVLNSHVRAEYSRDLGIPIGCAEDRYLVARYVMSDEKDSFVFHSIFDCETGDQQSYECRAAVKDDTIILY